MKHSFFFWVTLVVAGTLSAEGTDPVISFEGPRIVGADVGLAWGPTKLILGSGYENIDVGRSWATGDPRPASDPTDSPFIANEIAKLKQTWALGEADLWVVVGVLGQGDLGLGDRSDAFVADRRGGAFGFFQTGVTRDRRTANAHQVRSGTFAEAFVEAGPALLSVRGTDYFKASVATSALVPLWDLEGGRQTWSGVLGLRANAQYIDGASVPLLLLEPTEVRGYHRLLDTKFRSVATSELRVGLPSLWGDADLIPVVLAFAEGGWYQGYANAPASASGRSGWLASVGAGVGMTVFGLTTPTLTVALPLVEESALWWKVNFNVRF
jgi:hypothetical protein